MSLFTLTVPSHTTRVEYRHGAVVRVLEPGRHPRRRRATARSVDRREALLALTSQELARRGAALPGEALSGAVSAVASTVGVEVRQVVVKDVILPAELRAAALEVLAARARGVAQLEAARAETAALRSLANGARLLDAHPALARQRLVQSAPDGATVVLRFGDNGDPGTGATAT